MSQDRMYRAIPFEAPEGSEIIGEAMMGFFDSLASDVWEPILRKYRLSRRDIRSNEWYPYQIFLDLCYELHGAPNGTEALVANGKAIGENFYDDRISGIEEFLNSHLNAVVMGALRNVPQGIGYLVEKQGHNHYRVTNNIPSDNETVYGYLWESCRLYRGEYENFVIRPVRGYPGSTESAVFDIQWGEDI